MSRKWFIENVYCKARVMYDKIQKLRFKIAQNVPNCKKNFNNETNL